MFYEPYLYYFVTGLTDIVSLGQAKAYNEVHEVLGKDSSGSLTMEKLQNLPYLERFIKETLRIYPSVPVVSRELSEDIVLPSKLQHSQQWLCVCV